MVHCTYMSLVMTRMSLGKANNVIQHREHKFIKAFSLFFKKYFAIRVEYCNFT